MDIHFFSTGDDFPYYYYLAVMSALKTQHADKVNLFITEKPNSRFFKILENTEGVNIVNLMVNLSTPDLLALKPLSTDTPTITKIRRAHLKDYIGWKILYTYGGVLLDLDTFCIHDLCRLADTDKEVAVCVHTNWRFGPVLYPFANIVVIAKPHSAVIKEALDESTEFLSHQVDEGFTWGCSGPMALSNAVHKNYHLVNFLPPGTFGPMVEELEETLIPLYRADGILPTNARVVHLFASTYRNTLNLYDAKFVEKSNTLYAKIVRGVLTGEEWKV